MATGHGHIPNTPLSVDNFRHQTGVSLYFLTHMHTDHTIGLTPSWNNGHLFMSLDSFKVYNRNARKTPRIPHITSTTRNVRIALSYDKWEIFLVERGFIYEIPLIDRKTLITLRVYDAQHCPGAVMYLFEGYFGRILHTGDFRNSPEITLPGISDSVIDYLYLDNTYCHPQYQFPDRKTALEAIFECTDKIIGEDFDRVYIVVDTLGKEEIGCALAEKYDRKVVVTPAKYETLSALDFDMEIYTTDPREGFIQLISKKKAHTVKTWILGGENSAMIHPSAFSWCKIQEEKREALPLVYQPMEGVASYVIPYSLHCCYSELVDFIRYIRPRNIVPTTSFEALNDWFKELLTFPREVRCIIPDGMRKFLAETEDVKSVREKVLVKRLEGKTVQKRKSLTFVKRKPMETAAEKKEKQVKTKQTEEKRKALFGGKCSTAFSIFKKF